MIQLKYFLAGFLTAILNGKSDFNIFLLLASCKQVLQQKEDLLFLKRRCFFIYLNNTSSSPHTIWNKFIIEKSKPF